jgi:hypothetical protein
MKPTGLLTATIILAALAGGIYWSNKAKEAADKAPPKDAPPKILTIPESDIKTIRLQKPSSTTTLQKSDAGKWQITEPNPLPADNDAVSSLVSTVSSLTSDRLIEDKPTDLASYGLATPTLEVLITKKDGKTEDLLIGDDAPTGSATFVKLKTDPRVFTVSTSVKSSLDKTSERPARQAPPHLRFRQADPRRSHRQEPVGRIRQEQSERSGRSSSPSPCAPTAPKSKN